MATPKTIGNEMRIIPAIDLIEGKCVRLSKGDYSTKKMYNENPLEVAMQFEDAGLKHLHLVDLDGAQAKRVVNWKVLEKIASKTSLHIDFGGGVRSDQDLRVAFECGAWQITGGSIAVKDQKKFSEWITTYGAQKIILGADAKEGKIAVSGWEETTSLEVGSFINHYLEKGIKYVISTDITKDGMLEGPSHELYRSILETTASPIALIASGGVCSIDDLTKLNEQGLEGVIIGKALYEGKIELNALRIFL